MEEAGGSNKLSAAQAQVGEVVDVMRVNVEKVLERDNKLSELNSRAENLQEGANQFQTQVNLKPQNIIKMRTMNEKLIDNCFSGNSTEEKVLVAEHEDDDDHWSCRLDPADHYYCLLN